MYDKYLDKIFELIKKQPEHLLKDVDGVWQKILNKILKLNSDPLIVRKRFCRPYFREKAKGLCKIILDYVKLEKILAALTQNSTSVKFSAVEDLIYEVFSIKSGEVEMCQRASKIIVKEIFYQLNENLKRYQ